MILIATLLRRLAYGSASFSACRRSARVRRRALQISMLRGITYAEAALSAARFLLSLAVENLCLKAHTCRRKVLYARVKVNMRLKCYLRTITFFVYSQTKPSASPFLPTGVALIILLTGQPL